MVEVYCIFARLTAEQVIALMPGNIEILICMMTGIQKMKRIYLLHCDIVLLSPPTPPKVWISARTLCGLFFAHFFCVKMLHSRLANKPAAMGEALFTNRMIDI
jgi:hypothetical protein